MLNGFFDKIYCINLDRRTDRWDESLNEFKKYGLDVERVSAIDANTITNNTRIKSGALALTLTVIKLMEKILADGHEKVLILEDDVEFTNNINIFNSAIKHLPDDWDMLYFGGNHNEHAGSEKPTIINNYFMKLHNTFTTHCVGFKKESIKDILEFIKNNDFAEIDVIYAVLQKHHMNAYCFRQLIATQRESFSDIENMFTNYKNIIK